MTTLRISRDVVNDARILGHGSAELETNRSGRTRVHCSCGYTSTYRNGRDDAMGAFAHHLGKVVTEYRTRHGERPVRVIRAKTPAEVRAAGVSRPTEASGTR